MDDEGIIELYWSRSETAIAQTERQYGRFCYGIAYRILRSREDSEECVSDTWQRAWDTMPPQRPQHLGAFLGRITRNLALNRRRAARTARRGGGQVALALDELAECLPGPDSVEKAADEQALAELLDRFLEGLGREARIIFVQRYWYLRSVREIAADLRLGESAVKMSLSRTRERLRRRLEEERF